jgi:poly(3-hydroxybutyrate) depolymerase
MHSFLSRRLHRIFKPAVTAAAMVLGLQAIAAPIPLQNFNVDITQTSVSGLSSGGFMAVQFSVAYSSIVKGAGIVAGGPYYCARGDVNMATSRCSCTGISLFSFSSCRIAPGGTGISQLVGITHQNAREGSVDPTVNLARQRIWLFSGASDSIVPAPVMNDLHAYYRHFIADKNIQYRDDIRAEHALPTDSYGNACDKLGKPFINNCKFDGAGELLKWIYGGDLRPKQQGALSGKFIEFDQREFFGDRRPNEHGMADSGFLYAPQQCDRSGSRSEAGRVREPCKLHIAFHGCQQSFVNIDDKFVKHAGYNQWADTNDMIVLYPQTVPKPGSNPNGCWNWFDFDRNDADYATKNGIQMAAVKGMVDRVAGMTRVPSSSDTAAPRCFTSTNAEHVLSGRAYDRFLFAVANGSNQFMGLDNLFSITTLKQTGPGFYVIGSCD